MKRMILFSLMALMTIAAFGRKNVENATVVADTIFYAEKDRYSDNWIDIDVYCNIYDSR